MALTGTSGSFRTFGFSRSSFLLFSDTHSSSFALPFPLCVVYFCVVLFLAFWFNISCIYVFLAVWSHLKMLCYNTNIRIYETNPFPRVTQSAALQEKPNQRTNLNSSGEYITNCIFLASFFIMLIYKIAFMCIANTIYIQARTHKRLNVNRFSIDGYTK